MTRKIIIDTDPGIDDAMAILLAFSDPRLEVVGLTTIFGNVTTPTATRNALRLTELAGREVPVAEGAHSPLVRPPHPPANFVHGTEGFGTVPPLIPARRPDPRLAQRFIAEKAAASPGEITLVALGPLTNLALMLRETPEAASNLAEVVVMGGAVRVPGNVSPRGEANIWNDPHAADAVFDAPWKTTLVGLDVTMEVICTPADFARLADVKPVTGGFLNEAAQFYFDFHRRTRNIDGCFMHDPTALIALTDPELFGTEEAPLSVGTEGAEAGRTAERPGSSRPAVTICFSVDAAAVRQRFLETLCNGPLP